MKLSARSQKTWTVVLGVVAAVLIVNLVSEMRGTRASASTRAVTVRPEHPLSRQASAPAKHIKDDLSRYDPTVDLGALKQIDGRPEVDVARNPFDFPAPKIVRPSNVGPDGKPLPPPPPPPPPPLPIKAVGFADRDKGVVQVVLTDDQGLYVVSEGEIFNKKYRVIKITSKTVEVEDDTTHQTSELPLPQ